MKKTLWFWLLLLPLWATAQRVHPVAGVWLLNGNVGGSEARRVAFMVSKGIADSPRVRFSDVSSLMGYEEGLERVLSEARKAGHELLFTVEVDSVNYKESRNEYTNKKTGETKVNYNYRGKVQYGITYYNLSTGKVSYRKVLVATAHSTKDGQESMDDAIANVASVTTDYINALYPVNGDIKLADEVDKSKGVRSVYVSLGKVSGVYVKEKYNVYRKDPSNGRPMGKSLGKLEGDELISDHVGHCVVKKGGKEIKAALDNGDELVVASVFNKY